MEFLSFSPTPSVNHTKKHGKWLRRSFLHFHFISSVHIWFISYIINTKKHSLPVEKPSLSVAQKNNLHQRWTELCSAECRKKASYRSRCELHWLFSRLNTPKVWPYMALWREIWISLIGQLHDDVILLQLPESLSLLFSCAN